MNDLRNNIIRLLLALFGLVFLIENSFGQEKNFLINDNEKNKAEYFYAFTEATKQMIYGDFNQAIILYKKCLEYNPGSAAIYYQLSRIFVRLGDLNKAAFYGLYANELEESNKYYIINLIDIYRYKNQFDSSIIFNKKLIRLEPDNINYLMNLALFYQVEKSYKEALLVYDSIEKQYGKAEEIYLNRYKILNDMGKSKRASDQLHRARMISPEDEKITGMLAEHYRDLDKNDSAEYYYSVLLNSNSKNEMTYFSYCDYLIKNGMDEKAFLTLKSALVKDEINIDLVISYLNSVQQNEMFYRKPDVFFDQTLKFLLLLDSSNFKTKAFFIDYKLHNGKYSDASAVLKKLIILNKENYLLWEKLLFAESALSNNDTVIKYGNIARSLFSDKPLLFFYTGIAYNANTDYENAAATLEEGIKFVENKSLLLNYNILLGDVSNSLKREEKTILYYENAFRLDSTSLIVRNNYAYYLAEMNRNLNKALDLSRYTIIMDKRNVTFLDTYAWILYKLNDKVGAKRFIKQAMKYGGSSHEEIVLHYNIIVEKK